jgi:hypothetical protein
MRHHYVPQFLLRAWAETQPDKRIEVFRLDLPGLPSSRHTPKYTAYEDNLYALTMPVVAGMKQQAVEKHLLQHIDNLAADMLRKLTTTGLAGLTLEGALPDVTAIASTSHHPPIAHRGFRVSGSFAD